MTRKGRGSVQSDLRRAAQSRDEARTEAKRAGGLLAANDLILLKVIAEAIRDIALLGWLLEIGGARLKR